MPMRLIRLDSDGVTCEMIEVRMASFRRVMAVTSMKALNSCRLTWPCDSPNGASGSRYSVSMKPSITISASAGTSRSTVFAFTTLIGAPTSAPATCSSSSVSGSFCTEAKVTHGRRAEHHRAGQLLEAARAQLFPVVVDAAAAVPATVQKLPETLDELHVAGALVGAPINVVKAKTVDLLVPAEAEIVIEGFIDTQYLEPEAPFGELHGHVNLQEFNAFMDVTAITRRKDAILTSIISQVTPSESSLIKLIGMEPLFLNFLRNTLGIKGIKRVSMHEPLTNIRKVIALICERDMPTTEVWRAMYGAAVLHRAAGKFVIAVNDDIDPTNADALLWAMSYRANASLDIHVMPHRDQGHGPRSLRNGGEDASVLIDATLKEDFPPISLPKREYMERAKKIWEELGLPKLKPELPWFGYSLGEWGQEFDAMAERAVRGDYLDNAEALEQRGAKRRRHEHRSAPSQREARRNRVQSRADVVACSGRADRSKIQVGSLRWYSLTARTSLPTSSSCIRWAVWGLRMGVVCYRCPDTGEEVTTAIETSKDTLVKMRAMDLTMWVWCPHCMAGHQIKPADAVLEDEIRTTFSPALAG